MNVTVAFSTVERYTAATDPTMIIQNLHSWDLTPKEAIALQKSLRHRVSRARRRRKVRTVAGVDVGIRENRATAAAVLMQLSDFAIVDVQTVSQPVTFPYVPGLLSIRETPVVLEALSALCADPDLILVDGHGIAHPRRFGIACHIGVLSDIAVIGCAKSRLCGAHREPGKRRGSRVPLADGDEVIGEVVRTRDGVKPIYVSVGHKVSLPQAVDLVLECGGGYRLPEATRLAHNAAAGRLATGKRPTAATN